MAFVNKAERKLDFYSSGTSNLGPGSYSTAKESKPKPSYAPFSTTTERNVMKSLPTNSGPGPGSYATTTAESILNPHSISEAKNLSKLSSNFASKLSRFKEKRRENSPGPGSYDLVAEWAPQRKESLKRDDAINWIRMPSAPSIPAQNQAYGYEEAPSGVLVMQKSPQKIYSGTKKDCVGPGHYNPKDPWELSPGKGTEWYKSNTKRTFIAKPQTGNIIGPGSYSQNKLPLAPLYKSKPSASFVSTTKRIGIINVKSEVTEENEDGSSTEGDEGIPGPGYYYKEEAFTGFKKTEVPRHLQNFGSRSSRFQYKNPDVKVAPGQYQETRKSITTKKTAKAPFDSTENRFKEFVDPNPGPGSYKDENILDNIQKKVWGKEGVFGSTEKRFVAHRVNETPGPGYYVADESRVGIHNSSKHKPSSVFSSRVKRDFSPNQSESPAPGHYEISTSISGSRRISHKTAVSLIGNSTEAPKKVGFNSNVERFDLDKNAKDPLGPGSYQVDPTIKRQAHSPKFSISKEERFKQKTPEELPGPGAYHDEYNEQTWNKKSYNILYSFWVYFILTNYLSHYRWRFLFHCRKHTSRIARVKWHHFNHIFHLSQLIQQGVAIRFQVINVKLVIFFFKNNHLMLLIYFCIEFSINDHINKHFFALPYASRRRNVSKW
ncbi:unnamed protein product [Blepharisma stoltei]|uniref:Sperm-tail PG-rich repeat-containing protein 2 n=1 Tax=Blepharisma stoltei TaxID=1481888 RepID=A0AAU9ILL8_9CILI|nr:unnamed protein product [Blepharisma stoltei]